MILGFEKIIEGDPIDHRCTEIIAESLTIWNCSYCGAVWKKKERVKLRAF